MENDQARKKRIKDGYRQQQDRTLFNALKSDDDPMQHTSSIFMHGVMDTEDLDEEDDNEGDDLFSGGSHHRKRSANNFRFPKRFTDQVRFLKSFSLSTFNFYNICLVII